jgi:anti-sigma factor RsiW
MNEHLHFTDEEIVDYLDGSMEGQLRDSLEAVLATDETLKMRVEKMRVAIIAVKQLGLKEKIRAVAAEEKGKQTTETRRYGVTRKILRYSMVAAASVIVFIVLFKVFDKKPGNEDLYLQAYVDYQDNGVRGNENVSPIEDAYRQKNIS